MGQIWHLFSTCGLPNTLWLLLQVKAGMSVKPCGLVKPCHLVTPVSTTRISGRYRSHQQGLPTLPVPPLQQTFERYIAALEPIVEAEDLQHTKALVQEFQKAGGVGERLQKVLEKRAKNTENWVSSQNLNQDTLLYVRTILKVAKPK